MMPYRQIIVIGAMAGLILMVGPAYPADPPVKAVACEAQDEQIAYLKQYAGLLSQFRGQLEAEVARLRLELDRLTTRPPHKEMKP